jgi:hypothetical protein
MIVDIKMYILTTFFNMIVNIIFLMNRHTMKILNLLSIIQK